MSGKFDLYQDLIKSISYHETVDSDNKRQILKFTEAIKITVTSV